MMLSASSSLITRFGIVLCEVFSAARASFPECWQFWRTLGPSHYRPAIFFNDEVTRGTPFARDRQALLDAAYLSRL
jgi:hypothetical protein